MEILNLQKIANHAHAKQFYRNILPKKALTTVYSFNPEQIFVSKSYLLQSSLRFWDQLHLSLLVEKNFELFHLTDIWEVTFQKPQEEPQTTILRPPLLQREVHETDTRWVILDGTYRIVKAYLEARLMPVIVVAESDPKGFIPSQPLRENFPILKEQR